jgi:hypothetical protein
LVISVEHNDERVEVTKDSDFLVAMLARVNVERSVKQAALYSGVNVSVGFNHVDFNMLHVCILSVAENGVLGRPVIFPGGWKQAVA